MEASTDWHKTKPLGTLSAGGGVQGLGISRDVGGSGQICGCLKVTMQ